jgi:hypothetical protein
MIAKRVTLALALLAVPAALDAQQERNRPGAGMRAGMAMRENVAEFVAGKATELELSQEQVTKINALGKELRERDEARRAESRDGMQRGGMPNAAPTDRQRMERRQAMMKEADEAKTRLLALLDGSQKEKAAALIDEWERSRPAMMRRGERRPG